MTAFSGFFSTGRPVFGRPSVAGAGTDAGDTRAAWQGLLSGDPEGLLRQVSGPFAVAIGDAGSRVVLAVDRFCVEVLYYAVRDGVLHVGSRADTVAGPGCEIDPQALFDYFYFHAIPSPRTVFKGVYRLPPGHLGIFSGGQVQVRPYWIPSFQPVERADFASLREEFRGILRSAVADSLGTGKAACYLSGGTDSSTVAGMIREVTGGPAATYSIGFDAAGYDEMAFARVAAKHFGAEHHEYYVTPADLVSSIPQVAASFDQPFGNSSAVPAFCCARMAREDGVTRLLAGDGGDELFGGNKRYATQRVLGWWDEVPGPLQAVLRATLASGPLAGVPGFSKAGSYIRQSSVPLPDRLQTYNLLQRLGVQDVLTPGFLKSVDALDPARQQKAVWAQAQTPHQIDRNLAFDWRYTLAENDLPKVRGSSSLADVQVGFPMLDQRLVDFSCRLPPGYKLRGLKLRWFFKEALRGFLPDEILTKKKQGFGLPFGVWATTHAPLFELARDSLASLGTRGIVQPGFIDALLQHRLKEHPGYYGEMVWILMMLEQWLRQHAPNYRFPA